MDRLTETGDAHMDVGGGEDGEGVLVGSWRRWAGCIATLMVLGAVVWGVTPAEDVRTGQAMQSMIRTESSALRPVGVSGETVQTRLELRGESGLVEVARESLEALPWLVTSESGEAGATLRGRVWREGADVYLEGEWLGEGVEESETVSVSARVPTGWSLLPPIFAVVIALWFRQLIVALMLAVWGGAVASAGGVWGGTVKAVGTYAWGSVADSFNLSILLFTFCLVGMVHIIIRMGGIAGVLKRLSFLATSMRSTRLATALMGFALFFDDYANTVVVGTTMRPLTDRQRISREKLAYLVDSTSAPIAGLAVISTWIGFEVGLFDQISRQLSLGMSGYEIFFDVLPMRFYCIFTLIFVFLIAWSGRAYGPMRAAEERARRSGRVRPKSQVGDEGENEAVDEIMTPKSGVSHRWQNAVIPVTLVILGTLIGMIWSGWRGVEFRHGIPGLFDLAFGPATFGEFLGALGAAVGELGDFSTWREAFSNANNATVLLYASLLGTGAAGVLAVGQGLLSVGETIRAFGQAIPLMATAAAILILAWSIQDVCSDLGTGVFLVSTVRDTLAVGVVPLITFLLAGVVAFSTGTSWGTMGILLPAMVPLAYQLAPTGGGLAVMMTFGAVLDGAIFGDHCSPISDTTVMSSMAASVDHLEHVRTQIPYAMTTMGVSALVGYLPVAFGVSLWVVYPVGVAALVGVVWLVGESGEEVGEVEAS